MRSIKGFVIVLAGLSLMIFEYAYAAHPMGKLMFAGIGMTCIGLYLAWTDFIAPRMGVKTWEDGS